ncbi:MAG: MauE/DoxX family redox-associated membrane protein [Chloroflexota bacterium]
MSLADLAFAAAVALGVVFLVSGSSKLRDPNGFVVGVLMYQVLPPWLAIAYGKLLPFAELICGLALVLGVSPSITGSLATVLLLSFLIAVAINLARGRQLVCHCLGSQSREQLGWTTLARLCVLLICAAAVTGWQDHVSLIRPPREPIPALLLALGLVLGLYLLSAIPPLWRIWHTPVVRGVAMSGRVSLRSLPLGQRQPPSSSPHEALQGR